MEKPGEVMCGLRATEAIGEQVLAVSGVPTCVGDDITASKALELREEEPLENARLVVREVSGDPTPSGDVTAAAASMVLAFSSSCASLAALCSPRRSLKDLLLPCTARRIVSE